DTPLRARVLSEEADHPTSQLGQRQYRLEPLAALQRAPQLTPLVLEPVRHGATLDQSVRRVRRVGFGDECHEPDPPTPVLSAQRGQLPAVLVEDKAGWFVDERVLRPDHPV